MYPVGRRHRGGFLKRCSAPFQERLELGASQHLQVPAQLPDLGCRRRVLLDRSRGRAGRQTKHQPVARRGTALAFLATRWRVRRLRPRTVQNEAARI
jgi:hypothetical protein